MKAIMIVGLGSMGKRRLRLLKKLCPELTICGVDRDEIRREFVESNFGISTYASIAEAVEAQEPEAAVVSTSPLSHSAVVRECLEAGLHVFTELNLVSDGYQENTALANKKGKVLFLSSTFLFREENKYIIDRVKRSGEILNYRFHVGQYLPDWHPWERYQDYFVGDARTNGCRELLAIELPWLCATFGPICDVQVIRKKCTKLQINYADSYMLLVRHKNGHQGSICIDVVSRKPVRLLEVYGENLYLTWGGQPDTLREWDVENKEERVIQSLEETEHQQGYAEFIVENAYENELVAFLDCVRYGKRVPYSFVDDLETLRWIDHIELTEG